MTLISGWCLSHGSPQHDLCPIVYSTKDRLTCSCPCHHGITEPRERNTPPVAAAFRSTEAPMQEDPGPHYDVEAALADLL